MADVDFTFGMNAQKFAQMGSTTMDILFYTLIAVIVVGLIWGCLYLLSFKHRTRVRKQTASGYVIIDTKAREFKTKSGIKKWRLLAFIRDAHIAPTNDYLELTNKGKFSAECDISLDGMLTWRKRSQSPEGMDRFTSEERSVAVTESVRANSYVKKKGLDTLMQMAPMIMVMIIVILLFAFWGDITKTTAQTAEANTAATNNLAKWCGEMTTSCKELCAGISTGQTIDDAPILDKKGGQIPN